MLPLLLKQPFSPLTGIFRNPKFDDVVLFPELDESDPAQSGYDETEGDVPEGMAGHPLPVVVEEPVHAANDEVLDGPVHANFF